MEYDDPSKRPENLSYQGASALYIYNSPFKLETGVPIPHTSGDKAQNRKCPTWNDLHVMMVTAVHAEQDHTGEAHPHANENYILAHSSLEKEVTAVIQVHGVAPWEQMSQKAKSAARKFCQMYWDHYLKALRKVGRNVPATADAQSKTHIDTMAIHLVKNLNHLVSTKTSPLWSCAFAAYQDDFEIETGEVAPWWYMLQRAREHRDALIRSEDRLLTNMRKTDGEKDQNARKLKRSDVLVVNRYDTILPYKIPDWDG